MVYFSPVGFDVVADISSVSPLSEQTGNFQTYWKIAAKYGENLIYSVQLPISSHFKPKSTEIIFRYKHSGYSFE